MVCGLAGDFRGASPSSSWPGDLCGAHALSVLTDSVGDRSIPRTASGPRVHLSGARKGELSDVESRARTGGDAGLSEASAGSVPCALALGPADYVNTTGDVGLPIEHGHEEASG